MYLNVWHLGIVKHPCLSHFCPSVNSEYIFILCNSEKNTQPVIFLIFPQPKQAVLLVNPKKCSDKNL